MPDFANQRPQVPGILRWILAIECLFGFVLATNVSYVKTRQTDRRCGQDRVTLRSSLVAVSLDERLWNAGSLDGIVESYSFQVKWRAL